MKKYFFTGLILLLPILLTLYILIWLLDLLTEPFMGIVTSVVSFYESKGSLTGHHEGILLFASRICILIFLVGFIFVLGFLCQKITKRVTIKLFSRIPFVPALYRITKEVTKAILSPDEKTFKGSVLVPFPKEDSYALGLITGEVLPAIKEKKTELELSVFVPTSPHPLSGYVLMTSKRQAIPVNMTTEEVFKFLLSAGASHSKDDLPN